MDHTEYWPIAEGVTSNKVTRVIFYSFREGYMDCDRAYLQITVLWVTEEGENLSKCSGCHGCRWSVDGIFGYFLMFRNYRLIPLGNTVLNIQESVRRTAVLTISSVESAGGQIWMVNSRKALFRGLRCERRRSAIVWLPSYEAWVLDWNLCSWRLLKLEHSSPAWHRNPKKTINWQM